jgi:carbamoyltransferase
MGSSNILCFHAGHNASACLMRDGQIVSAALEERFCRKKNYVGYPKQAIDFCLKKTGIAGRDLRHVAYTTKSLQGLFIKAKTSTQFSISDYMDYYGDKYYGRKIQGDNCADYLHWLNLADKFNEDEQYYDFSYLTDDVLLNPAKDIELFRKEQARLLSQHLQIEEDRVEFLDHHTCHAYYAYFASPFREQDCIVVTLDGWGDGRNQTVWKVTGDKLCLLADSDQNDLGRIYKMATLILAMRPDEHEFKVMGLAPYAKGSYVQKALQVIENLSDVDGMRIVHKERPQDLYSYLKNNWEGHRFDNIAGAVQVYTERIAKKLIQNIYEKTGIGRFVLSGGISMNVKMNKAISEMDCVSSMFVCGSGGDESLSIGGCYYLNDRNNMDNKPIANLYLGYDIDEEMVGTDFEGLSDKYALTSDVKLSKIAEILRTGEIVAVIRGQAEFGARALGNRSILADPSRRETVIKINEAIKNRDFWMPFALSILEDHQDQYIENPKHLLSPFMAMSCDTKPEKYSDIEAGTHPYDKTVRPQFVSKQDSPAYYALIEEFYKLTGIPAVLNTSFNLHGEPIVNNIADAIRTFELSGLDHLLINDKYLLSKKKS